MREHRRARAAKRDGRGGGRAGGQEGLPAVFTREGCGCVAAMCVASESGRHLRPTVRSCLPLRGGSLSHGSHWTGWSRMAAEPVSHHSRQNTLR